MVAYLTAVSSIQETFYTSPEPLRMRERIKLILIRVN